MTGRYAVLLTPPARRALAELLPPGVAAAAWELITGALADDPWRVGKPLHGPYEGLHAARRGTYRVLYKMLPPDEAGDQLARSPQTREAGLHRLLLRSRWPRPSRLPQHRPVPGVLAGICVLDPGSGSRPGRRWLMGTRSASAFPLIALGLTVWVALSRLGRRRGGPGRPARQRGNYQRLRP